MDAQRDSPNRPFQPVAHTTERAPYLHAAPQQPAIKTTPYNLVQEAVPQQPHLHTTARQPPQHAAPQQPAIKTTPYNLVQEAVPQQPHLHTTPRQPPQQAIPQQPVEHTTAQQPGQHAAPQRPVQADKIQLLVKNFSDSKNYAIRVSPTTLVQDFMNLIADTIKGYIPNSQQMLTYAGKVLESGKTIADYGIQSNQTIYLTGRLRGG
ncbi:gamma-gliadin [Biomphalaria glabrata]|uniref:Ubiquitin-like domain-containing protein n=1 Tax=Biomphalaria glabrata TaxID=6526 RepID=A0A2C9LNU9_BIOGL|nr:gamma-gliadin [Biomphalaria glabrata]